MKKVQITLVRGLAGKKPKQVKTVKALGLTKRTSSVIKEDNAMIRGMIRVVNHLVEVQEVK